MNVEGRRYICTRCYTTVRISQKRHLEAEELHCVADPKCKGELVPLPSRLPETVDIRHTPQPQTRVQHF